MIRWEEITRDREAPPPWSQQSQEIAVCDDGSADLSQVGNAAVNGGRILDLVHAILEYYAWWERPEWIDITTLWIAHTWFADPGGELSFASTPRWMAIAPSGYGKSRMLELIAALSRNSTGLVSSDVTAPGVRNALHEGMTVILDEAHRTFGTGRAKEALQSVITGGYRRSGASLNGIGGVNQSSNFGPIALGAQPRIITGTQDMLEDLFNRSFMLTPDKASPGDVPDLDGRFGRAAQVASRALGIWASRERTGDKLWPVHTMPSTLSSRNREISQALLAVADRAVDPELTRDGGTDLRWAIRAREAVQSVLLGSGRPDKVMHDVQEQFEIMTRKAV